MLRQFTATCYVIKDDKVLLIYHKKFKKWMPPGGHIDPNETPPDACRREVFEETGLEIEIIKQENIFWENSSIERPYICQLQDVPAFGNQEAHQHMDMIYIGTPIGGKETENLTETEGLKWFTLDEIMKLEDIFTDSKETISHILRENKNIFV